MTRDEAHTATCKAWVCNSLTGEAHITTHGLLDLFIELGMLKLDEPKSVRSKTLDALFKQFGACDIETMLGLLEEAGLRIVEK